jgi:bifunctional non-homologous end joining protein LigD
LTQGERVLAVHVEDHPLDYATFSGEIPQGEYGAGTVEIWDSGTYELLEEKRDGGLTVRLAGERLQGVWTLVPAHMDGKEQNWLLIRKRDDAEASPAAMTTHSPMLATPAAELPAGDGWLYEVKFDGYRALAHLHGGECRLVSRNGNDLTRRFAAVAKALEKAVRTPNAVLDGEVCALDESGKPSVSAIQDGSGTLVYYVFDVLEVDGERLVELPLAERQARLRQLLDRRNRTVQLSEEFEDGEALLAAAAEQGLEGVVAKRADSPYREGRRTREWLKVKTAGRQEFAIAGYTRGEGRRASSFGSLVLAVNEGGRWRWVGNAGSGFSERETERLLDLLRPLVRDRSPFPEPPKMPRVRRGDVVWVDPVLVAEIAFGEWTRDGRLRHPRYVGLRDDKPAREVRRERPAEEVVRKGRRELRLSNLDKAFWPDEGITKGDLLDYYREIAPVLVPHLRNRPFTMRRYPDGIAGKAFFQKDAPTHMPDLIPTHRALVSTRQRPAERKPVEFPLVNDELALLWMANMGCIDMNPWLSRADRPDRPDVVLFDLDPTPEVPWSQTIEVALLVRELLTLVGLESFPKTSGGKGFHILVPLDRRSSFDEARTFAEHVAAAIVRTHPSLATRQWSKARRRGVLIDANQNGEGKTIASAYSVRPHPGAPVSTPLSWEEVGPGLDPSVFTMRTVLSRVERLGDLHAGVSTTRQSLSKALARLG